MKEESCNQLMTVESELAYLTYIPRYDFLNMLKNNKDVDMLAFLIHREAICERDEDGYFKCSQLHYINSYFANWSIDDIKNTLNRLVRQNYVKKKTKYTGYNSCTWVKLDLKRIKELEALYRNSTVHDWVDK